MFSQELYFDFSLKDIHVKLDEEKKNEYINKG